MLADRCQDLGLVTATCLPTAHVSCLLMLPPSTSARHGFLYSLLPPSKEDSTGLLSEAGRL